MISRSLNEVRRRFSRAGGVVERKTQELNYDNMVTYLAGSNNNFSATSLLKMLCMVSLIASLGPIISIKFLGITYCTYVHSSGLVKARLAAKKEAIFGGRY